MILRKVSIMLLHLQVHNQWLSPGPAEGAGVALQLEDAGAADKMRAREDQRVHSCELVLLLSTPYPLSSPSFVYGY